MPFCKYGVEKKERENIVLDNRFVRDYLSIAPENCIKVYLYGLLKCKNENASDNNIESFESALGLKKEEILSCFEYWQGQNVVTILSTDPVEIRFLSLDDSVRPNRKINSKKYAPFVQELQETLNSRQINPSEYLRYIDFIEDNHLLPQDFLMIVRYCALTKGENINPNYILTVASAWVGEGITTKEKIAEKIESLNYLKSDLSKIAKALKFKGNLGVEHHQMLVKWMKDYGFKLETIEELSKQVASKTKNFSFEMLDKLLLKYYENKLLSIEEIEKYEKNKKNLTKLARTINKNLGVYYESVEQEIDTYIYPWLEKGFTEDALVEIALFCFKNSKKRLEDMDEMVNKFEKLGLTTLSNIDNYLLSVLEEDNKIKEILMKLNIDRRVTNRDRDYYKTWTEYFNTSKEVLDYATNLSKGKFNAMQYLNNLLKSYFKQNLKTLSEVKTAKIEGDEKVSGTSFGRKSFTDEEVKALFDSLD